jgi:hypothetical protein
MGSGFKAIYENACNEYILFLENDFVIDKVLETKQFFSNALFFLKSVGVDIVRGRSRKYPGEPTFSEDVLKNAHRSDKFWTTHLSECIHFIEKPDLEFPDKISKIKPKTGEDDWYIFSSKHCNYTNNPIICSKKFFREAILPYCEFGENIEDKLTPIWATKNYKCVMGPGLFTHYRIDGHREIKNFVSLENKRYTWREHSIVFLANGKMDAFGEGKYHYINSNIINAYFGGVSHKITFSEGFTKFSSIRLNDGENINGSIILQ